MNNHIEQEGLFRRGYSPEREIFELNLENGIGELKELAADSWTQIHDLESLLKSLFRGRR